MLRSMASRTGLVRLARIELLPETDEKVARIFGSQTADPLHRIQLCSFPFLPAFVSKDELVSCVDLAEIVNEQHGYHPVYIDLQIQPSARDIANRAICQLCSAVFSYRASPMGRTFRRTPFSFSISSTN